MKNRFLKLSAIIAVTSFSIVGTVFAQQMQPAPSYDNAFSDFNVDSPLAGNITGLPGLINAILTVLITISIPIIVIAIVYAGFTYVTSQGNPEKIKTASRTLTYAVIGAVLIIGALVITEIIGDTITSFGAT